MSNLVKRTTARCSCLQVGPDAPPYADKILLSPHIYPASVIPRGCTGKGLCNRLSNSWGHLSVKVTCKRAPHLQPLQITKGGPALRQWQHHLIIATGLIKPCSAHHISCKGAVNSAGLLQRRTLPALSGAGWGDWQPAAGLPQPLQQSGASVHGVRTAGRLSAIKQRGELESRSTCVSGSNSPHWPQPSAAAAGEDMIWVTPRQFNLKELLHIASAGHIERAYLLTSIVQLLAYGQACCESSSLASFSCPSTDDGGPGALPGDGRLLARGGGGLDVVGLEPQQHRHWRHRESYV